VTIRRIETGSGTGGETELFIKQNGGHFVGSSSGCKGGELYLTRVAFFGKWRGQGLGGYKRGNCSKGITLFDAFERGEKKILRQEAPIRDGGGGRFQ